VWYTGGYVQDVWRPASNVTLTGGLRVDVPVFEDTGYANPNVDALTFRDETGAAGLSGASGEPLRPPQAAETTRRVTPIAAAVLELIRTPSSRLSGSGCRRHICRL